jgi:hypothetical protein
VFTDKARLLEMALKGLEAEQARIQHEIADIKRELSTSGSSRQIISSSKAHALRRRRLTAAHRKAIGERMKKIWAERKKGVRARS